MLRDGLVLASAGGEGVFKPRERVNEDSFGQSLFFLSVGHEVVDQDGEEQVEENQVTDNDQHHEVDDRYLSKDGLPGF